MRQPAVIMAAREPWRSPTVASEDRNGYAAAFDVEQVPAWRSPTVASEDRNDQIDTGNISCTTGVALAPPWRARIAIPSYSRAACCTRPWRSPTVASKDRNAVINAVNLNTGEGGA